MFSYVDEKVRIFLEEEGKLKTVDEDGIIISNSDKDPYLSILGPVPIPKTFPDGQEIVLDWYCFVRRTELSAVVEAGLEVDSGNGEAFRRLVGSAMTVNSIFAMPGFHKAINPLVRLHSCCLTGDIFGSMRCDCGPQLAKAFEDIRESGKGGVVYMSGHEGRGIGLWAKAATYLLQDTGQDTYQANRSLGLPEDSRDFSDAAVVLKYLLPSNEIQLLSNNPEKIRQLEAGGISVSKKQSVEAGLNKHNRRYLKSKRDKGHLFKGSLDE